MTAYMWGWGMVDGERQIQVEVFLTDEHDRRERCAYALPAACILVVVYQDHVFGPVWGFLAGTPEAPEDQMGGLRLRRDDGLLFG
jgi:hypothetical protein